jgi:hypothetical protein
LSDLRQIRYVAIDGQASTTKAGVPVDINTGTAVDAN